VQWLFGWKNIPNFEGNLEFWAKKFRDVPIHSPEDYSKLLEVSATLFSDSHLPPSDTPSPPSKNGVSRNWSVMFKPTRGNSTLAHDANHKEIALNMQKVEKKQDSNPDPPTVIPSATHAVQIDQKDDEILPADEN
jgi:hypothetical protein